jgi:hypothetical protein
MTRRTDPVALHQARERTIAALSDAFAEDRLDVDDFEDRLALAYGAESIAGMEKVVSDLEAPRVALAPLAASPGAALRELEAVTAIFGGVERRGRWLLPPRLEVIAVFGGVVLDLREALFLAGRTEIHVVAVMGGAQVIVPPGVSLEVSGSAILGGFAQVDPAPGYPDREQPLLRVHGRTILGGVAVETRLPGESEQAAHRRRSFGRPALGR